MQTNTAALQSEIRATLRNINQAVERLKEVSGVHEDGWLELESPDGTYPAHNLLLAKSNCLNALAVLQAPKR